MGERVVISGREVDADTVGELLDAIQRILEEERERRNSLTTRAAGLTGIVGLLLSLAAVVGAAGGGSGSQQALSSQARIGAGLLVSLALVVLAASVVTVVSQVLLPGERYGITIEQAKKYPTLGWLTRDHAYVRGHFMNGALTALEVERDGNDRRARWLKISYWLVVAGLILVTFAGVAATVDRYVL